MNVATKNEKIFMSKYKVILSLFLRKKRNCLKFKSLEMFFILSAILLDFYFIFCLFVLNKKKLLYGGKE